MLSLPNIIAFGLTVAMHCQPIVNELLRIYKDCIEMYLAVSSDSLYKLFTSGLLRCTMKPRIIG
ncbi:hypothetical protein J40TS1_11900 [Paenibacillus montaniterrae]|uniref:Uncharacterized protein n=1 Tax=Paenibacillus montaniterrae TaxID=429341 RepID=A0A920CXQ3_9BACL|nr:hypothetical protein J40TS1_11900 [Paenibacillus montaniterrae]